MIDSAYLGILTKDFALPRAAAAVKAPAMAHVAYRPDIDGLRAVAVLSVVVYHAMPPLMRGGFVGVDVFFVISGYLISSIIFGNLKQGTFSFADFYIRRVKRIFPALLTMLVSIWAFGWFFLLTDEYKSLGRSMAAGSAFVANFYFWGESSYFNGVAIFKPLIHLWSLGIEEQFYIVWPIVAWGFWKARGGFFALTLVIAVASFVANIYLINIDPTGVFYSPLTRAWELMVGSAMAYASLNFHDTLPRLSISLRSLLSVGAMLLLGFALTQTDESSFPGFWALAPVGGAILLVAAGPDALVNRGLLASRPLVLVGKISFPLYLWHWPLLSLLRIVNVSSPSPVARLEAIIAAIALSLLTYILIEKPIRLSRAGSAFSIWLGLAMVGVCALGYGTYAFNGFDGHGFRSAEKSAISNFYENNAPDWRFYNNISQAFRSDCSFEAPQTLIPLPAIPTSCYVRDTLKAHVAMLWGDSHAEMLYYGLANTLPADWQVMIVASPNCAPDASVIDDSATQYCKRSNWFALSTIVKVHPDVVVMAQVDNHQFDRMTANGRAALALGAGRVVFTGPVPQWDDTMPKIVLRGLGGYPVERTSLALNRSIVLDHARIAAAFALPASVLPKMEFVDLYALLCNAAGCLTQVDDTLGGLTSFDYGHLTPNASKFVAERLLTPAILGAPGS
jgi:peptidoglycan/LPS O-acetylase OafA/YrhL